MRGTICWRAGKCCRAGSCAASRIITNSRSRLERVSTARAPRSRSNVSTDPDRETPVIRGDSFDSGEHTWDAGVAPRLTPRRFALHGRTASAVALLEDIALAGGAGFDAIEIGDDKLTGHL